MASAKRTAEIVLKIDANTKELVKLRQSFEKFGKDANKSVEKLDKKFKAFSTTLKAFIGFLAVRRAFRGLKNIADELDFIIKTSDRLNITVESLQQLQFVAKLAAVEFKAFTLGLQQFSKNVNEARIQSGKARTAFEDLSFDFLDVPLGPGGKIDIVEVLVQLAAGVELLDDPIREVSALFDVLGRQGPIVLALLKQGPEAIREQVNQLERLGVVFSETQLGKAAQFNDALVRVETAVKGVTQSLFVELAPAISAFFEVLAVKIADNRGLVLDWVTAFGRGLLSLIELLAQTAVEVVRFFEQIGGLFPGFETNLQKQLREVREELDLIRQFEENPSQLTFRLGGDTISRPGASESVSRKDELLGKELDLELLGAETLSDKLQNAIEAIRKTFNELRADLDLSGKAGTTFGADMEAALKRLQDALDEANPNDFFAGFEKGLEKALESFGTLRDAGEETAKVISDAFVDGAVDIGEAFGESSRKGKQAYKDLTRSVLRDLGRIIAKQVAAGIVSLFVSSTTTASTAAKGAVFQGGLTSIPMMQAGGLLGVTRGPSLAVVGEGENREAVIPLPDNRNVHAIITDPGRGGTINLSATFLVQSLDPRTHHDLLVQEQGQTITDLMLESLASNEDVREQVRSV